MSSNLIYQIIEQIAAAPGKNDKLELLDKYMTDDLLKVLKAALDPFITYGIRPSRATSFGDLEFHNGTWAMLYDLESRRLSGSMAQEVVTKHLESLTPESSELLWRILNKDLKAGFSEASVNKVRKGTFKDFPYMRCSLPKDAKLETWPWNEGVISQTKADGMFVFGAAELKAPALMTRQGNALPPAGFEHILEELELLCGDGSIQTHGELTVLDEKGVVLKREVGNGIINKVMQGGTVPEGYTIVMDVWDMIPADKVVSKGKHEVPYLLRLRALNTMIRAGGLKYIRPIETRVVKSLKEAYAHYAEKLKMGMEGTVIKLPKMIWKDGTSKEQIKLKLEAPCELRVDGFEPGKEGAKTEKTFGSLQLSSACGMLKVNCSGFSDALRQEIHDNRDDWMGAIVQVTSNGIMYSDDLSKKAHSLFLPRFDERRDKVLADDFKRIEWQFENAISLIEAEGKK